MRCINTTEGVQLCWGSMWCHSWHSSGSQGDTATAVCHSLRLTVPKPAQRASQPAPVPPSRLSPQLPGICKRLARFAPWIQNIFCPWNTGLICINRVALGTARDKDKGHLSLFPSVETLCSFAGCFWTSRITATLRQVRVPSSQLHFSCSSLSQSWKVLGSLSCLTCAEAGELWHCQILQSCSHGRWQNCAVWTKPGSHKVCGEGSRIDARG